MHDERLEVGLNEIGRPCRRKSPAKLFETEVDWALVEYIFTNPWVQKNIFHRMDLAGPCEVRETCVEGDSGGVAGSVGWRSKKGAQPWAREAPGGPKRGPKMAFSMCIQTALPPPSYPGVEYVSTWVN